MDSLIKDLIEKQSFGKDLTGSVILILIMIWSLIWKGFALWYSAKSDEKYWFVAILILNTAGILEIAYLFFFAKTKLTVVQVSASLNKLLKPKR